MPSVDRIHELLPWFVAGTLGPAESESFRGHLPTCRDCREELAVLRALRDEVQRHGEDFFRDHPPADRLVAAVRGDLRDDMDEAEASVVRRHLALCSTCATEARWATGASVAGAAVPLNRALRGTGKTSAARPWAWALVAAVAVFAVMLPWGLRDRPGPGATGVPPTYFVAAPERSQGDPTTITVSDDDPVISLMFEMDLPASSFPAAFVLRRDDGTVVTQRAGIRPERLVNGTIVTATCARKDCPDGSYAGVIRPAAGSGESEIEIPFRLRGR